MNQVYDEKLLENLNPRYFEEIISLEKVKNKVYFLGGIIS